MNVCTKMTLSKESGKTDVILLHINLVLYADRSRLVDESAWALSGGANPTATCVIEAKGAL